MKNGSGHFALKLSGPFELESGAHFKLKLGGQYQWNLHLFQIRCSYYSKILTMELFFKAKIDPVAFLNGNYIVRVYSKMKISKFLIEYHVQTFKLKYCIGKSDLFCTFEYSNSFY